MGGASPPKLGGQIEKKKFWEVKIRKNNKIEGKILIFFFLIFFFFLVGPLEPQGGSAPDHAQQAPPSPNKAPPLTARNRIELPLANLDLQLSQYTTNSAPAANSPLNLPRILPRVSLL
jgi:hypothetical protein